jgi:hypothetical protein
MKDFDEYDEHPEEQIKGPQKLLLMSILALIATIYAVVILVKFIKEII